FKKRYGLLVRRQRRHGDVENPAEDIDYLAECVPRFMPIVADTSPAAMREQIVRVIVRRQSTPAPYSGAAAIVASQAAAAVAASAGEPVHQPPIDSQLYADNEDDPEVVLQNALRQLQQEEAEAEASAASVRQERERAEQLGQSGVAINTPTRQSSSRISNADEDLNLKPISSAAPVSNYDRPVLCPFCVNQRMLRTIKEAVEHLSTHVVV
ncbi:unnamed protein product, partial [Parascedosporium putredinis]